MAGEMSAGSKGMVMGSPMSIGAFVVAWAAMMAAMMLPAALPAVRLYARVAQGGRSVPVAWFVAGYLGLWTALGVPAFAAWRALEAPLADGQAWAARAAGLALVAAAAWQLTPLKTACLRHCRSPLGFFLAAGDRLGRPLGAIRMGVRHGTYCLGCCWALFAVLVALGTMQLPWMVALTALIVAEKRHRHGRRIASVGAGAFAVLGAALLFEPSVLVHLT